MDARELRRALRHLTDWQMVAFCTIVALLWSLSLWFSAMVLGPEIGTTIGMLIFYAAVIRLCAL